MTNGCPLELINGVDFMAASPSLWKSWKVVLTPPLVSVARRPPAVARSLAMASASVRSLICVDHACGGDTAERVGEALYYICTSIYIFSYVHIYINIYIYTYVYIYRYV